MKAKIKNMSKIFIGTKLLKKLNKIHKHLEPYYENVTVYKIKGGGKHFKSEVWGIINEKRLFTEEQKQLDHIINNRLESDIRSTIIETNKEQ
jgi:hypothetical protein